MHFQFLLIKALASILLGIGSISVFDGDSYLVNTLDNKHFSFENKISVRESNTELQISVGEKIFVFGKAKGTLDKIKVGMNVLHFSQATDSESFANTFSKVTWKKLIDGSIQIQSSYSPWPKSLSWTVFADGRLKMEASAPPLDFVNSKWLGLGFNFPDQLLHLISWYSIGADMGQWENLNYVPMADPEKEVKIENEFFLKPIRSVRMEFESVIVEVSTETMGVFFGLGENQHIANTYPNMNTDMVFLFNQPNQDSENKIQSPSGDSFSQEILSQDPLVLWFHFQ